MRLALLGIVVNVVFSVIKLLAGYFGHSHALIADGIESTLDIAGSFIIWSGLKLAAKPADDEHPYGHGKAEPIAAVIVGFGIIAAAVSLAYQSGREFFSPHPAPKPFTLVILVVIVVVKEALYRLVMWYGNKMQSTAVKTDAGHHRSDAITSLAAFAGISISLIGGPKWGAADNWAALFACALIAWNGVALLKPAIYEIMDTAPPKDFENGVRTAAASVEGVKNVQQCRIRKMGMEFYVDLHVWVNGSISVYDGHRIAHAVKDAVRNSNPTIADVLVHVEPH